MAYNKDLDSYRIFLYGGALVLIGGIVGTIVVAPMIEKRKAKKLAAANPKKVEATKKK